VCLAEHGLAQGPRAKLQRGVGMAKRQGRQREVPEVRPGGFHPPIFRRRAALYVDGFNLYHAVAALDRNYLKWLDLHALGRAIAPRSEAIKRVVWCSAYRPQVRHKLKRHEAYHHALANRGVVCRMGHFVVAPDGCNACGHAWSVSHEKQGDVNLALSLLDDAHANRFDVAYLVTTDGDHAATARWLKQAFPRKRLVIVAPPGRRQNRSLLEWADAQVAIGMEQLEASLLPELVRGRHGLVQRPPVYDPPHVPRSRAHLTLVASSGTHTVT